jgi:two-component system, sporulation sensor kinase B
MKQNYHMRATLTQSEKLQVVSELAASIAHEVRNPITAVRGFTQLLSQDESVQKRFSRELSIMISELDRAHHIISDYFSFARPEGEEAQVIHAVKYVSHAVSVLTPFANANSVTIKESYQDQLYVTGHPNEIEQALINLIKNAIEAYRTVGPFMYSLGGPAIS